jgi:hypothetical protein
MNRRDFLAAATGGCLAMSVPAEAADTKNAIIELRRFQLRNTQDNMRQRTNDFLANAFLPALKRAGAGPVGAFTNIIGQDNPYILLVTQFANAAAWEGLSRKLMADDTYQKAGESFYAGPLQYIRQEVDLLRGFDAVPVIEVPPARSGSQTHVFELRTYESNNMRTLRRKIKMFNEGEIELFRKLNMRPVFFGETIAGRSMPNLTYMIAFDDLASREKIWSTFVSHPEWKKMSSQPGVSDGEIVSNITNSLLGPTAYSMIR